DLDRAERVDRALRRLVVAAEAEGIPLPPVYAITVDDDEIELRIAPAAPNPPAPWIPLRDGRRWRLHRESAEADQGPLGSAPYPGLVCIGRDDDGADVLIDLEAVGGPASVSGADAVAREVVSALAVQLVTSPWSDDQVVHSFELSPILADVADGRFTVVDDLPALVTRLEGDRPDRTGQDVLSGRVGRKPDLTPQYLLLGTAPDDELVERLQPMVRTGDRGLGVVAVGRLPGTRWHLTVDESGHLALPLLDIAVTAVRLTERSAVQLAGLFAKAREQRSPATDAGVVLPRAPRPGDDAHWASADVRIGVLGALETRVPGQLDEVRVGLATEVATFLALQSGPVHPSVLAASVWPRGVTAEVRDATVERVREWLGHAADGSYLLRENDEGRLFLADDVAVDWHAFCTLVQRSRGVPVKSEVVLLRRALQLVRGPFLDRRERGRYSWLARTRLDTTVADAVEATAHRLVELSTDDPDGAAGAARAGLRLVPESQLLWRDLLRAEYDGPGGPGVAAAVDQMWVALAERGAELEAETEALVEELVPGAQRPAGSLAG
uniref:bacterial transcriptional activator domain-containing protein n=1 Tax=Nocardioides pelophilus TaxID=2172019 RepID=UPI001C80894F